MELAAAKRRIRQLETELAVSRKASTRCSSNRICPKSLCPAIASLAGQGINVQRACAMLDVAQSGYYNWKGRPPSARTHRHAWRSGSAEAHRVQQRVRTVRHGRMNQFF